MITYSDFCSFDIIDPSEGFVYLYYKLPDGICKDYYFIFDNVDVTYQERFLVIHTYLNSDPENLREIKYFFDRKNIILFIIHNNEVIE